MQVIRKPPDRAIVSRHPNPRPSWATPVVSYTKALLSLKGSLFASHTDSRDEEDASQRRLRYVKAQGGSTQVKLNGASSTGDLLTRTSASKLASCIDGVTASRRDCTLPSAQEELFKEFHGTAGGRIHIWYGLRQIMNATDSLLLKTKQMADKYRTGIHMHVSEIPFENSFVSKTRSIDHGTVTYLNKIGLLGHNLLAAHSVWVDSSEVQLMARASVKVSHCPASNLRMLGFAPVQEMLEAGVCVSLGTDGAPSNNRMSLVDEMYLASLIHKGKAVFTKGTTDPTAVPAECIIKMATIDGAKAVLQEKEIGSLEVGKKADLVVVNPNSWTMSPVNDPIASLVYCMRTENIDSVMCDGHWIMRAQKILTVDEAAVLEAAKDASSQILKRAKINIPQRMNVI